MSLTHSGRVLLSSLVVVLAGWTMSAQTPTQDPRVGEAMSRGETALRARRWEEALRAFKEANELEGKKSPVAMYGMSRAYHGLRAFRDEDKICAEALKHVGDDRRLEAILRNQRGMALYSSAEKNTDKAIRDAEVEFRTALGLAEAPAIAHYNLGVVLLKQSRDPEAIESLTKYLDAGLRTPETELAKKLIANPRRGREDYAPDYSFTTRDGRFIASEDFVGKTVLLDFWGTWCGPCRAATPDLVRLYKKYAEKNFEMLGISSDAISAEQAWKDYIDKHKMGWPQFLDRGRQVHNAFAVRVFPTYVVVDAEGIIRQRQEGWGPSAIPNLEAAIRRSLSAAGK